MSLLTGGTNANSSLSALLVTQGATAANVALLQLAILDDINPAHPVSPGAYQNNGLLYIPNRGVLRALPGDYVMVDSTTGWPILLSAYAIASGPWAHS